MNTIQELSQKINDNATAKGFWENGIDVPEKLMLIVSEISEAMEADRKSRFVGDGPRMHEREFESPDQFIEWFAANVKDTFEDELADAAIRIFDLAFQMKIDLDYHILAKMKYNKNRPFMHGGKKY